ncbi:aspartate--tRNA(Asn) ligase [Calidifontibacter sp. DB0510]|uniref:Aspartate--tRNA(Asp/Asn) ligase n=1 Tax=Metallococcus carri TaxID=1656884 RepID=A0A967EA73_9MICO|nr:aspartate--tRNA(Asn) ligase [Metallococcus carri]NHN55980.1 aspartate--tRNA(Asn) ligase [Metallococcus carri]NOP37563.1 aspartate--tRNA(Asn) ligase [Calidifontibacter sp. DB2511S]
MQRRILSRELPTVPPGETVTLAGWIHRRRQLASVSFLVLRDRSGLAQVVARSDDEIACVASLPEETVVEVTGRIVANEAAPGGVEVVEPRITALTEPAATPPVELWRPELTASLPTLLDHAAVTLRHPKLRARAQLAAASLRGLRCRLGELDFTEIQTPKLVEMATESGANVFEVDYFGRTAYLAQSPQLFKQMMVGVHERVFEVGPVFRAEPHDTVRHLAQYTSIDVELGFIRDHRDVLAVLREAVAAMVSGISDYAGDAASLLDVTLPVVPQEIPVIHFADALALVGAPADEPDLEPAHERALSEWALAEHGSDFLAVEGYPMAKRPFYTHPQPDDGRWSNSFDLLFRGLELTTGGQRLHRPSDYRAALARTGQDPAAYTAYLEAFEHGMPPHGGFAIGLERWVGRLVEAPNIREVTLFPRDLHRLAP